MLTPAVAGWRKDALEIVPDAERTHSSCLLWFAKIIIFWATSCQIHPENIKSIKDPPRFALVSKKQRENDFDLKEC